MQQWTIETLQAIVDRPLSRWDRWGIGQKRFQPDLGQNTHVTGVFDKGQRLMAAAVGCVAVGLPLFLWLVSFWDGAGCQFASISHHYYSRLYSGIYAGCLFFVATFMLGYSGQSRSERRLTFVMGLAALALVYFPTDGDGCLDQISQARVFATQVSLEQPETAGEFALFPGSGILHSVAAGLLLLLLTFYAAFGFTRIDWTLALSQVQAGRPALTWQKRLRNRLYLLCAGFMALALMAVAAFEVTEALAPQADFVRLWKANQGLFWAEFVALIAFGIAWAIKGRLFLIGYALADPVEGVAKPWILSWLWRSA